MSNNTKTYSAIRLFNHLLVIFQLLGVISICLISCYFRNYFRAEELLKIPGLTLSKLLIITAFINLIVPFFGACSIDSKVRLYMKLFSLYIILNVLLNILILIFVNTQLIRNFQVEFSRSITQETGTRMFIESEYNCSVTSKPTCLDLFVRMLKDANTCFKGILILFIILNSIMAFLVRISLFIKYSKIRVVPEIDRTVVGFSTVSLRSKRMVGGGSPSGSVLREVEGV